MTQSIGAEKLQRQYPWAKTLALGEGNSRGQSHSPVQGQYPITSCFFNTSRVTHVLAVVAEVVMGSLQGSSEDCRGGRVRIVAGAVWGFLLGVVWLENVKGYTCFGGGCWGCDGVVAGVV